VPRVIAEVSGNDLMYLLQRPGEVIAMLVDEVEKHGFDGLVGQDFEQFMVREKVPFLDHIFSANARTAVLC
jgi:hypothetical protein